MDRKPAAARVLILALAGLALAAAEAPDLSTIHAARWLAPGADRALALGSARTECLSKPHDPQQAYMIEVGRAAFRTPLLLGGQAARAGIACESCHQGGRSNPDFFFPGLSGAPGTADVTSALFSSHRDDGVDNPKPIPDLSGPKDRLKVSQDPASPALPTFIHGLVTQEFDGAEPPPAVLAGVATYVRALSPSACPAEPRRPLRIDGFIDNAQRAVRAAHLALDRKDSATAIFLLGAARTQLGLINERFDQPVSTSPPRGAARGGSGPPGRDRRHPRRAARQRRASRRRAPGHLAGPIAGLGRDGRGGRAAVPVQSGAPGRGGAETLTLHAQISTDRGSPRVQTASPRARRGAGDFPRALCESEGEQPLVLGRGPGMSFRANLGALVLAPLVALLLAALPLTASHAQGMTGAATPTARGPSYDPNDEFHKGAEALGAGRYRAAKQNFEHVLAMVPDQPVALSMLGQSEAGLGDLKGAARAFEASLHADPHQVLPARELALTDEKLGRHDKALAQLQKLKVRADACADSCAEAGDLSGAVRDVEAALSQANQASAQSAKPPGS